MLPSDWKTSGGDRRCTAFSEAEVTVEERIVHQDVDPKPDRDARMRR